MGFNKFENNSSFGFTVISKNSQISKEDVTNKDIEDKSNYFEKVYNRKERKMTFNEISFEYDPGTKKIKKFDKNSDNFNTSNDELLYDANEEKKASDILAKKRNKKFLGFSKTQGALNNLDEIKHEKEDNNKEFLNDVKVFVRLFKENKLKKFDGADEIKRSKDRIIKLKSDDIYYILKKRIKEILKLKGKKNLKEIFNLISEFSLKKEDFEKILKLLDDFI